MGKKSNAADKGPDRSDGSGREVDPVSGQPLTFAECWALARQSGLDGFTTLLYAALLAMRGVRWE